MAVTRTRNTWTNVLAEIRTLLSDTDGTNPYYTDAVLLELANAALDQREAELDVVTEGYSVVRATVSLVAGQAYYKLPDAANRVRNVTKMMTTGEEIPLHRTENLTSGVEKNVSVKDHYRPLVRMQQDYIYLAPAPIEAETDSLIVYYEQAREKLTTGADQFIPDAWPHLTETLVKYDVACFAYGIEESVDPGEADGPPKGIFGIRNRLERTWREQIESRMWGQPTFSQPFVMTD